MGEKQPLNPSYLYVGGDVTDEALGPAEQCASLQDRSFVGNTSVGSPTVRSGTDTLQRYTANAGAGEPPGEGGEIAVVSTEFGNIDNTAGVHSKIMHSLGRATSAGEANSGQGVFAGVELGKLETCSRVRARRSIELGAFLRTLEEVSRLPLGAADVTASMRLIEYENSPVQSETEAVDDAKSPSPAASDCMNDEEAADFIDDCAVQIIPQG